jgi:hypothetical protein
MKLKVRILWPTFRRARPEPIFLSVVPVQEPIQLPCPIVTLGLSSTPATVETFAPFPTAEPIPIAVSAGASLGASQPLSSAAQMPAAIPFLSTLIDRASDDSLGAVKQTTVRQVPPPKLNVIRQVGPGILRRSLSWLRKNYSPSGKKQLRVTESISLGEKRFVAIIHAEGHKFLIGGGSTGVSLLTQLGESKDSAGAQLSIHELAERTA